VDRQQFEELLADPRRAAWERDVSAIKKLWTRHRRTLKTWKWNAMILCADGKHGTLVHFFSKRKAEAFLADAKALLPDVQTELRYVGWPAGEKK